MAGRTPRLTPQQARVLGLTGRKVSPTMADLGRDIFAESAPAKKPRVYKALEVPVAPPGASVLALDLALGTTGWALVRPTSHGLRLEDAGTIRLPDTLRKDEGLAGLDERRYLDLGRHVAQLIERHEPYILAFEFPDKIGRGWWDQKRSPLTPYYLGIARGLLVGVLTPIFPPDRVLPVPMGGAKGVVTGNRHASKDQVRRHLILTHGWDVSSLSEDASDAAAIAAAVLRNEEPER